MKRGLISGAKPTKKEQERHYVELFKSVFADFPDGKILDDSSQEKPDVIVLTAQGRIGIEVTRIYHKSPAGERSLKQMESERGAVVLEALRIYEKKGLPNLLVKIDCNCDTTFNKRNRGKSASALANLVASNIPQPNNSVTIENDWKNSRLFPYEFCTVDILRLSSFTKNYWDDSSFGYFREYFVVELQEVISGKESKLRSYSSDCAAHWLLVVAENSSPSSFFDPSAATLNHCYNSSFDRVFLLEPFGRSAFELKLCPRSRTNNSNARTMNETQRDDKSASNQK